MRPPFVPLEHAYATYDASLTYISDNVVLFWHPPFVFSQCTLSPFIVDCVEYNCAEQFMMASKARLYGDDTALSAILASDDPREQNHLGRHVLWQSECENIVLHGNLAKFSQNEEMHLALIQTGDRRLAEASPHDNLWGIGLSACDPRASSPDSWCGQNLLGQALEHAREIFRRDITAPLFNPAPETPVPQDDTGDYGLRGRSGHTPSPRHRPPFCQHQNDQALGFHRFGTRRPRPIGTLGPRTTH